MTQARIDAQTRRMLHWSDKMLQGNNAMGDLVNAMTPPSPSGRCSDLTSSLSLRNLGRFPTEALGKNWNGFSKANGYGKVTPPAGSKLFFRPLNQSGFVNYPHGAVQNEALKLIPDCPCYNSTPCSCEPRAAPRSTAVSPARIPTPSAAQVFDQSKCRTDNICRDLRSGCVRSDQVTAAQLYACARSGWSGNYGLFPQFTAQQNLPWIGEPMLSPPQAPGDTWMEDNKRAQGLSGLFESGFDVTQWGLGEWLIAGAGVVLAASALKGGSVLQSKRTFRKYKQRLGV
jgi:hypothetical protein